MKILKSRWYLRRITSNTVLLSEGTFSTETAANARMYRNALVQPDPRFQLQERIPAFEGVATIKGADVIKRRLFLKFDREVTD